MRKSSGREKRSEIHESRQGEGREDERKRERGAMTERKKNNMKDEG